MRYHFCPKCGSKLTLNEQQDKNKPFAKVVVLYFIKTPLWEWQLS